MFNILSRSVAFLTVRHSDLRRMMISGTAVLTIVLSTLMFVLPLPIKIFGSGGLNSYLITVFTSLPGFYVAALAAVATFDRPEMDEEMAAPAPSIKLKTLGRSSYVKMTTRMFLTFMFAYLVTLSFVGLIAFIVCEMLAPSMRFISSGFHWYLVTMRVSYVVASFVIFSNMLITTIIGLYFLAERMHRGRV